MSERNTPTHIPYLDLEYNHLPCVTKQYHMQMKAPPSVKEELKCGLIHKLYSPVRADYDARPTLATLPISNEHRRTTGFQESLITGPNDNIGTIFRIKNIRPSADDNMPDERAIVRSRSINPAFPLVEGKHICPILDGKENHIVEDIEFILLESTHEVNNRTQPLFESNRLLPALSGQGMNYASHPVSYKLRH